MSNKAIKFGITAGKASPHDTSIDSGYGTAEGEIRVMRGQRYVEIELDDPADQIKLRLGTRVVLLVEDDINALDNGFCPNCDGDM